MPKRTEFTYAHNGARTRVEALLLRMTGTHYCLHPLGLLRAIADAANDPIYR